MRLAGSIDDREIRYRPVEDDEYRQYLTAQKLPGAVIDGLLGLYAEFRSGWAAQPSHTLGRLIDRTPVDTLDGIRQRVRG